MKKVIIWIAAGAAVLILAALLYKILAPAALAEPGASQSGNPDAEAATDFRVYTYEGYEITLSSMRGKVTVVNFWATWCGYCVSEMPSFEKAYSDYGDDVNFMMVNLSGEGETPKKAKSFAEDGGYTFPLYYDTGSDAYRAYTLTAIPRTLIIAADGSLYRDYRGAMNETTLYSLIDSALEAGD